MGQPLKCLFQSDLQKCPVEKYSIEVRGERSGELGGERGGLSGEGVFDSMGVWKRSP